MSSRKFFTAKESGRMMGSVHDLYGNPDFERRLRERYQRFSHGGGGGDDGMWQQSVEGRLEGLRQEMRSDLRWTLGGMAAMFVLLGSMIIGSYLLLDNRLLNVDKNISEIAKVISEK